jgi:SAM domain (Sterile alpha motif)
VMDLGGWLRSLGLEEYEAAFHKNHIDEAAWRVVASAPSDP